jgi:hypothetical protein
MSGGGGGQPTQTNVTQSNIPDWLRPQVEQVLGGATQQLFNTQKNDAGGYDITGSKPFTPYSQNPQDYVAGFSPLQQQVQGNAANLRMPGQFDQGTQLANMAGQGGLNTAAQGAGYGQAGFQSGMQGQTMGQNAYNQANQNANMAQNQAYGYGAQGAGYGQQAAGLAGRALGYGDMSSQIGQMGLNAQQTGQGITAQSQDLARQQAAAGQNYSQQATDPGAYQKYMNPFTQNVTNIQNQELQRNADIASTKRGAQAVGAGAFGGSRHAIENAEAQRNLQQLQNQNQVQGSQQAYNQAQQNMQYGANLGLQGLSGAQSGLGTALQGGQLGLSGIGTALQGQQNAMSGVGQAGAMYGLGMQGAQSGLQGVGQAINAGQYGLQGAQTGLQGTAQGMQGAGVGLSGVGAQQAGYNTAGQMAGQLGNLGNSQLAAQTGILGLQNQVGGQQQQQEQQYINNAINNYAQAQQQPLSNLNSFNALLRGYAVPGQTTTQYQAAPSGMSQLAGLGQMGIGGLGLYNAMNRP